MVTFGSFVDLSPAYWRNLEEKLDSDRQATVKTGTESVGGELIFFGFVHGDRDTLLIAKMPSHVDYLSLLINAVGKGMISKTYTFPVVDQAVFAKSDNVKCSPQGE